MSGIIAQNTLDNSGLVKAPAGGSDAWTFISKTTASADATVSITSGIDSTYKLYLITLKDVHRADGSEAWLGFNLSTDGGSSYDATKTTAVHETHHRENDTSASVQYNSSQDLAQSTADVNISTGIELGVDSDASLCGTIYLYDPSNTTFVKHFLIKTAFMSYYSANPWTVNTNVGGYANTTSAVDAVQFKMNSGNIDAGDFCLYGLTT
jgi:hypothetical protein